MMKENIELNQLKYFSASNIYFSLTDRSHIVKIMREKYLFLIKS